MDEPYGYHFGLQGQLLCVERLITRPRPCLRFLPVQFIHMSQTIVVTGGTKGLGLEYLREVSVGEQLRVFLTNCVNQASLFQHPKITTRHKAYFCQSPHEILILSITSSQPPQSSMSQHLP